jgi:tRNA-dihydrouridine synthase
MKIKDRPKDPAKWDEIVDVVYAVSIPVIANGDIFAYKDFKRIKDATGLHFNNTTHLLPYQLALSNTMCSFY